VKITPRNGFLLVEPCDDPFEKGPLLIERDAMLMQHGRVVTAGSGEGEYRRTFAPGDIVFYEERVATGIIVDREETQFLVNETMVMAYIPAADAVGIKSKSVQAPPPPSATPIVTPKPGILLN
jgi:hypothetical protein